MKGFWEKDGMRQREACNTPEKIAVAIAKKQVAMMEGREREAARQEWIATLPENINGGEVLIDKIMCGFTDQWGGWLMGLPEFPVTDIEVWFNENLDIGFVE